MMMTEGIKINILVTLYEITRGRLKCDDFEVERCAERFLVDHPLAPSTTFAEVKNEVIIDGVVAMWGRGRDTVKGIDFECITDGEDPFARDSRDYYYTHSFPAPTHTDESESLVSNRLGDGDTLRAEVFVRDPDRFFVNCVGYLSMNRCLPVYVETNATLWDLQDALLNTNPSARFLGEDHRQLRITTQDGRLMRAKDSVRDLGDDAVVTVERLYEVPAQECSDEELEKRLTETVTRRMIHYAGTPGTHPRQGPRLLAEVDTYHDMEIILTIDTHTVELHRRPVLSTILLLSAEVGDGSLVELLLRNRGKYLDTHTASDVGGVGVGLRLRVSLSDPPFDIYDPKMNISALDTLVDYCYTAHIPPTVFLERDLTMCLTTWADYMGFRSLHSHLEYLQTNNDFQEVWRRKVDVSRSSSR